jgi:hypothetical protein
MIGRYAVLASRIRQDVAELERVVERVERLASRLRPAYRDVSAALLALAMSLEGLATEA